MNTQLNDYHVMVAGPLRRSGKGTREKIMCFLNTGRSYNADADPDGAAFYEFLQHHRSVLLSLNNVSPILRRLRHRSVSGNNFEVIQSLEAYEQKWILAASSNTMKTYDYDHLVVNATCRVLLHVRQHIAKSLRISYDDTNDVYGQKFYDLLVDHPDTRLGPDNVGATIEVMERVDDNNEIIAIIDSIREYRAKYLQ